MPSAPTTLSALRPKPAPKTRHLHRQLCRKSWRLLRLSVLSREPLCRTCGAPATEVDHIVPRRAAPELLLVRSNLQALCKPCHTKKTVEERS